MVTAHACLVFPFVEDGMIVAEHQVCGHQLSIQLWLKIASRDVGLVVLESDVVGPSTLPGLICFSGVEWVSIG